MKNVENERIQFPSGVDCISAMCSASVLASGGHEPVLQDRFFFFCFLICSFCSFFFYLNVS